MDVSECVYSLSVLYPFRYQLPMRDDKREDFSLPAGRDQIRRESLPYSLLSAQSPFAAQNCGDKSECMHVFAYNEQEEQDEEGRFCADSSWGRRVHA